MPAASSSRRSRRSQRDVSEDGIEEDQSTQQGGHDDVEDEEEQPRRSGKSVKREKSTTQKRQRREIEPVPEEPAGGDDEEDDAGRIDVENFQNQPLDKKEGQKITGIASDWSMMQKNVHDSAFALVRELGSSLADVAEGEQGEKMLTELDIIMRDLIDVENEMISHESTLEALHQEVLQGESIDDISHRYEKGVKSRLTEYRKKTTRQKYSKSQDYAKFKQAIFEVQNPDTAMPPVTDFLPKEDGDVSDDDDIEIGGMTQDYRCPLTLTTFVNPMTSQVCGHSFSGDAIKEFFKHNRTVPKPCPASGCRKSFTLADLKVDKDLERRAKAAARRAQRAEDDSD
ncbi:hypothetical protein JAAARDRAFT_95963, partial [Jaapia argillacea MUCL 33604]